MYNNKNIYAAVVFLLVFQTVSIGKIYGKASWYGKDTVHDKTDPFPHTYNADGSLFDENAFTCAMRSRDFGGLYKVCNPKNKKCVIVQHRDFGPGKKMARKGRIIDLSMRAFSVIANLDIGVINVSVERIK